MEQPITTDQRLLARYADEGSQAAFAALTERYIRLVYSTCYRELRQKELAEEATQAVFLMLAKKAKTLRSDIRLSAWLYATARFLASNTRREERRRKMREQHAYQMAQGRYERTEEEAWSSIEPALNDALSALPAMDQEVLFLRFFEEMPLRDVGAALGLSDDAAQKRVGRALERLRAALASRKAATISVAALAALLSKHAAYAVPAHLPASVAQSASASSPLVPSPVFPLLPPLNTLLAKGLLIVSTTKIVAGVAAVVVLVVLSFAIVHKLHSPPPTTVWQAPSAADPASQVAQKQIQAVLGEFAHSLLSDNRSAQLALYSQDFVATDPSGRQVITYQQLMKNFQQPDPTGIPPLPPDASATFRVNSCSIQGDTATVAGDLLSHGVERGTDERNSGGHTVKTINYYDSDLAGRWTLVNTSGRWLISREEFSSGTEHTYKRVRTVSTAGS